MAIRLLVQGRLGQLRWVRKSLDVKRNHHVLLVGPVLLRVRVGKYLHPVLSDKRKQTKQGGGLTGAGAINTTCEFPYWSCMVAICIIC
jgi:hypothetical protein